MTDTAVPLVDDERRLRLGHLALALAASIALSVMATWVARSWVVGTLGRGDVPMAPSTAALIIASAWASWSAPRPGRFRRRHVVGAVTLLVALLAVSGALGILELAVLRFTSAVAGDTGTVPIGIMSPVSAVAFLLVGLALLMLHADRQAERQVGALAAVVVTLQALSVLVGYLIHVPVLYGAAVPMAAATSVALLSLGIGVLLTGPAESWPVSLISGRDGTREDHGVGSGGLALGLLVTAVVLVALANYVNASRRSVLADAEEDLLAAADSRAMDVSSWIRERLGDAQLILDGHLFSDEMVLVLGASPSSARTAADGSQLAHAELRLRAWMESLRTAYAYRAVLVFDAQGVERIREGAEVDPIPSDVVVRALASGTVVLDDIDSRRGGQHRQLSLLAPIHASDDGHDRSLGVVALVVDARAELLPTLARWPFRARTGEILLVRRDNDEVVYLNDLRLQDGTDRPAYRLPITTPLLAVARALSGERGPFTGIDYLGHNVLAAARPVVGAPWIVVAKQDLDEVYAPFWSDVRRASAFGGLLILATGFGLVILSRQQAIERLRATLVVDRARQDSDERLRAAMSASLDAFLILDEHGVIAECNGQAQRALGPGDQPLVGTSLAVALAPPHDSGLRSALGEANAGRPHAWLDTHVTVEARGADGLTYPAELTIVRIRQHGRVAFSVVLRDISEQVEAHAAIRDAQARTEQLLDEAQRARRALLNIVEDQRRTEAALRDSENLLEMRVRQRTTQLEAANRELEAFSYSVSHDLRAPLRAIDGYARMLAEDSAPRLDAEGLRRLDVVQGEARRMGVLIDDLLRFSRLGRQPLDRSTVNMTTLVREVVAELTRDIGNRQIDVRIAELPSAECDPALLRQVWLNLIGNACKFTGPRSRAEIVIDGTATNGEVTYRVRDNGVGFDMAYADKLFGVFQRLHAQDQFEGTGVGLALSQRIVNRHGGRMWATSEVGHGATFAFALPSTPAEAA